MIEVQKLTKRYAGTTALHGIDFSVGKGEIVGFLGPNGAGKSTTMRILSGFLPATAGSASIAGFDVFTHSLDARRHLGYMPENVPLYPDMRVSEYLEYRGALKGLWGRRLRERAAEVAELCGLSDRRHSVIGSLSKGYRQRVGLADALVHDPDLLILDEPTIGLDPNQIRQVRELIRSLGKRHTILLSSHILPEVEATCSRIIIIHKGRIAAQDTPSALMSGLRAAGALELEADTGPDDGAKALAEVEGVREVKAEREGAWTRFTLRMDAGADAREAVGALAIRRGWRLRALSQTRLSLEDVFVELTGAEV